MPESLSPLPMLTLLFLVPIPFIVICTCDSTGTFCRSKGHGWSYCMITWQPFVSPSGGPDLSSQTEDARWSDEQAHGRPGAGHQEWHQTRSVRVFHNRLNGKWAAKRSLGTWDRRTEMKHLEMFQRKKKTWGVVWDENEFRGYVYSTPDLRQGLH